MVKIYVKLVGLLCTVVLCISCGTSDGIELFDGETLEGWEGSNTVFRVEEGAIVGGKLNEPLEQSYYLCTKQAFENFELTLSAKFKGSDLNINGGISFRAERVPNSNEVMGYQADIGYIAANAVPVFSDFTPEDTSGLYPLWGCLVDENRADISRYPKPEVFPAVIFKVADEELIEDIINPWDWNEIQIKVNGPDIEIRINGVTTAKYTEKGNVPLSGKICLQAHSGGPYEVWYKNIRLKQLE